MKKEHNSEDFIREPSAAGAYLSDRPEDAASAQPQDGEGGIWLHQGSYTIEDYHALPEEKRVELIDGRFYEMEAPTTFHQALADEIYSAVRDHIRRNEGVCVPLCSPVDVQLNRDEKTMLQPDVVIVCDREKFRRGIIYGAPDLIVEVLSKSTKHRDLVIKLNKYYTAGVREYWIVDPFEKTILVYLFSEDASLEYRKYGREDSVPVGIFDGKCTVDFRAIFDYTTFLEDTSEDV